ncbi:hypothetical protein FWJ33_16920 [Leptospira interrogans serovar Hardjo]|nr:hypothetical protein FWJ33_16920 [Leptospira interrogans serovar Hardjo]
MCFLNLTPYQYLYSSSLKLLASGKKGTPINNSKFKFSLYFPVTVTLAETPAKEGSTEKLISL